MPLDLRWRLALLGIPADRDDLDYVESFDVEYNVQPVMKFYYMEPSQWIPVEHGE